MTQHILGIDIAKESFDTALLGSEQIHQGHFSNNRSGFKQLARWLKKRDVQQAHVCLEATSRYWEEVAEFLHQAGHQVSVVNPKLIKHHAEATMQRNKTDKQDALTIADYCAKQKPDLWTPPPESLRHLQTLVRHLKALKDDRQRARNRRSTSRHAPEVLAAITHQIAFLDEQITRLERQIQDHINQDPDLKEKQALLLSIPSVGEGISATFLAEVHDVNQFAQATQLAAFAGLTPGERQSGSSLRAPGRLVKWGNAHLRAILYMPALSAHRSNPIIAAFRQRLQERGKSKMTIVIAVMRKLLTLCYGVLKTGKPFDPHHHLQTTVCA